MLAFNTYYSKALRNAIIDRLEEFGYKNRTTEINQHIITRFCSRSFADAGYYPDRFNLVTLEDTYSKAVPDVVIKVQDNSLLKDAVVRQLGILGYIYDGPPNPYAIGTSYRRSFQVSEAQYVVSSFRIVTLDELFGLL